MGIREQIDIARGILSSQHGKCADCGAALAFADATKRSRSFDIICQPCHDKPRADLIILDEFADWQPEASECNVK